MACRAVLLCAVLACLLQLSVAQFGMPGMGMPEQPKAAAVKSDVQYIKCQACEAVVKQAYRHTKSKREGLRPGQKVRTEPGWLSILQLMLIQLFGAAIRANQLLSKPSRVRSSCCGQGNCAQHPQCWHSKHKVTIFRMSTSSS